MVWFALPTGLMFHFVAPQGNVGMEVLVVNEVRHSPFRQVYLEMLLLAHQSGWLEKALGTTH